MRVLFFVCAGRLCSSQDVLPAGPDSEPWFQTSEGKPGQAGSTGEETNRGGVGHKQSHRHSTLLGTDQSTVLPFGAQSTSLQAARQKRSGY